MKLILDVMCAVPSAFSEEGNGSFWSQPRSTPTGSISDMHSHRLDELSSHEFNSGAVIGCALSIAPVLQLHILHAVFK